MSKKNKGETDIVISPDLRELDDLLVEICEKNSKKLKQPIINKNKNLKKVERSRERSCCKQNHMYFNGKNVMKAFIVDKGVCTPSF